MGWGINRVSSRLTIYNTFSRKKELFTPFHPPHVKMYCCGPTVYDLLHIGNFRGAVFYNFFRHWLEHKGFKVTYAYNFTDVDDKILQRAKKENKSMKQIADCYILEFKKDFKCLKLTPHTHNPQATHYIADMLKIIQTLVTKKMAYEVDGDVFYHVPSFSRYGKLSNKKGEELISGVRIEVDSRKKDSKDFALWKKVLPSEPGWNSPWGRGRPGWHIECTTMIDSLLGSPIDIHGGGTDLIFPHHENEIAQAGGLSGNKQVFVKYWVHNNMFTFGGEKMAKSTGNQTIMRSFLQKYGGEIFKYLVLASHYRSTIEVSEKKIFQCVQALSRIYTFLKATKDIDINKAPLNNSSWTSITCALDNDLNTSEALAVLFTHIRKFNELKSKNNPTALKTQAQLTKQLIYRLGKIMSLFEEPPLAFLTQLDNLFLEKNKLKREDIDQLVSQRTLARKNKDFKQADSIRKKLFDMGIEVQDTPSGTLWETKKLF